MLGEVPTEMLRLLERVYAWPVALGLLMALALPMWAALRRARGGPPPLAALLLAAPSLGVALFELGCAAQALAPVPPDAKLHPAFVAFFEATQALLWPGVAVGVAAGLTVWLAPALRRELIAGLPAAMALFAWTLALDHRLQALALIRPELKAAAWFGGEPERLVGSALVVGVGVAAAAWARSPVAVVLALAPLLPLVCWPGFIPAMLLLP